MADYTVTVNRSNQIGVSKFRVGVNWINNTLIGGQNDAIAAGKAILAECVDLVCTHTSFFGIYPPWWNHLETESQMHWASSASAPQQLNDRVQTMINNGNAVSITFGLTPDWMSKPVGDWSLDATSGNNLNKIPADTAPDVTHFDDMATMATWMVRHVNALFGRVNNRSRIERIQLWNEYKGFWSGALNTYRAADMTTLYNKIYDAIKAEDSTILVGGLYPSLQTIQSTGGPSPVGRPLYPHNSIVLSNGNTIDPRYLETMLYWRDNCHGYDFVCCDGANKYVADVMPWFATEFPGKDVIWNEFYSDYFNTTTAENVKRAQLAINLVNCVKAGVTSAYLWQPERRVQNASADADSVMFNDQGLWTTTTLSVANGGGQRTDTADILKNLKTYFPPGTPLYQTTITPSTSNIVALASFDHVMVINNTAGSVVVDVT